MSSFQQKFLSDIQALAVTQLDFRQERQRLSQILEDQLGWLVSESPQDQLWEIAQAAIRIGAFSALEKIYLALDASHCAEIALLLGDVMTAEKQANKVNHRVVLQYLDVLKSKKLQSFQEDQQKILINFVKKEDTLLKLDLKVADEAFIYQMWHIEMSGSRHQRQQLEDDLADQLDDFWQGQGLMPSVWSPLLVFKIDQAQN